MARFHGKNAKNGRATPSGPATTLRVIGGALRGRRIEYSGDPLTRPMKDRVREAVFNLLGTDVIGGWAIDLFAGTGALGFEAISRGAVGATFCERHVPSAKTIERSAATLGIAEVCHVHAGNTFLWARKPTLPANSRWIVFCSPPYRLYTDQADEMASLLAGLVSQAPLGSVLVVESDSTFDHALLPSQLVWDTRSYPPAVVSISSPLSRDLPHEGGCDTR